MEPSTHDTNPSVTPGGGTHATPATASGSVAAAHGSSQRDLHDVPPAKRTRVSWGAIFAGAVVAVAITLLLTLLGVGGGLLTSDAITGADGLGLFAAIWYVISGTCGLLAGGYVAGRLAGSPSPRDAVLHGLTAWGLTTVFAAWLATSLAASLISGATSLAGTAVQATGTAVGGVASGVGSATGQVAGGALSAAGGALGAIDQIPLPDVDWSKYGSMANDLIEKTGADPAQTADEMGDQPVAAAKDFAANVRKWVEGEDSVTQEELIQVVTSNSGVSEAEARKGLDEINSAYTTAKTEATEAYETAKAEASDAYGAAEDRATQAYQTAKTEATEAAQTAYEEGTDALGTAALASFAVLLLGALAASFGASLGRPDEDEFRTRG
ncbi:hypothetical protein [Phycisphaera mikurensis]|uniref:hypothetical protein n=1 Tax=Phycisphaera mikurensis TaxID=547188 RepID=UPI0012B625D9|nr:hypothetical protein [Phycisphaera mikurensis]MBB6441632.1 vacuolar-type H+-ATPase subunit H [Phycisphaera mikurensis]